MTISWISCIWLISFVVVSFGLILVWRHFNVSNLANTNVAKDGFGLTIKFAYGMSCRNIAVEDDSLNVVEGICFVDKKIFSWLASPEI